MKKNMSADQMFSAVSFPIIRGDHDEALDVQARASGHAAGYAAGLRAASIELAERTARLEAEHDALMRHGQARLDRAIEIMATASLALARRTVPVLAEAHDLLAGSAFALAEAILGRELSNEETSAAAAVKRALASVDPALVVTVRLNPLDLAVFDDETLAATGVTFTPDPELARGDAVTELPIGYLDARITTAVARAKAAILGEAA
jgi:flagellar assembly protein FliH